MLALYNLLRSCIIVSMEFVRKDKGIRQKGEMEMEERELVSVRDFAALARTTAATLHHYDKIGLLSPSFRGENKYRYYARSQVTAIYAIQTLQGLGFSLLEIKELKHGRSPERFLEVLGRQNKHIDQKIAELAEAKALIAMMQSMVESVLHVEEEALAIQFLKEERMMLGSANDYSGKRDIYDALLSFYQNMQEKHPELSLYYPIGCRFSEQQSKTGSWERPERFYFHHPRGEERRPAALYAIGYARGGYGPNLALYQRMMAYIERNGFEVYGNAYQEYPLNEITVAQPNQYLIRLLIRVRERRA